MELKETDKRLVATYLVCGDVPVRYILNATDINTTYAKTRLSNMAKETNIFPSNFILATVYESK